MIEPLKQLVLENRWDICNNYPKHSRLAECGVFRGHLAYHLIRHPNIEEYVGIDSWWLTYGEYFNWKDELTNWGKLKTRDAYEEAIKALIDHPIVSMIVGDDLEVLDKYPDDRFDAIYIDSTHKYGQTVKELALAVKKVRHEGVISGHDYCDKFPGVIKAVQEFLIHNPKMRFEFTDNHTNWFITNLKNNP